MQINYCDLCNQPLKNERHIICIVHDTEFSKERKTSYGSPAPKTNYEVCPSCLEQIHKIFTLKKEKINSIIDHFENIYNLPLDNIKEERE